MLIQEDATFRRSLEAQVEHLVRLGDTDGITRLRDDLADLKSLLGTFPDAGRELASANDATLRKLKLRRCPFVVWYVRQADRVILARLFHARQAQPTPGLEGSVIRYDDPAGPVGEKDWNR